MNEYFCSVGKDLAEKIEYAPNPLLSGDYNVNPEEKCFRFKTIDVRNIRDEIGKIKISKGFGTDTQCHTLKTLLPTSLTHHSKVVDFLMIGELCNVLEASRGGR